jgi:ribosomal protein S27E
MDYIDLDKISKVVKCIECNEIIVENVGTAANPLCKTCYNKMSREYNEVISTDQSIKKIDFMKPVLCPNCKKEATLFPKAYLLGRLGFKCQNCMATLKWKNDPVSYYLLTLIIEFFGLIIALRSILLGAFFSGLFILLITHLILATIQNLFGKVKIVKVFTKIANANSDPSLNKLIDDLSKQNNND